MAEDTNSEWKYHLFMFSHVTRLLTWAATSVSQSSAWITLLQPSPLASPGRQPSAGVLLGTAPGLHTAAPGTVASQTVVT